MEYFLSNKRDLMMDLNLLGKFKIQEEQLSLIKENFHSESLNETETKFVINDFFKNERVLIDPHTAVAIGVAKKFSLKEDTIVLSTAHPSKFSDVVLESTGTKPQLPKNLKNILTKKENFDILSADLKEVKKYITKRI